jgi:hypothetical protein
MKPEPLPFMGIVRLKFSNSRPKNSLKNGSSSKGPKLRFTIFSVSILTTAGEHSFTNAAIGLVPSLAMILPAAAMADDATAINAKTIAKTANTFIRLVIANTSVNFIHELALL